MLIPDSKYAVRVRREEEPMVQDGREIMCFVMIKSDEQGEWAEIVFKHRGMCP